MHAQVWLLKWDGLKSNRYESPLLVISQLLYIMVHWSTCMCYYKTCQFGSFEKIWLSGPWMIFFQTSSLAGLNITHIDLLYNTLMFWLTKWKYIHNYSYWLVIFVCCLFSWLLFCRSNLHRYRLYIHVCIIKM